jgi:selenium-binding protein 1
MVSFMGDAATGEARGGFALFDQELRFKGRWEREASPFGYDFWYQPRLNVMISSGWGAPAAFTKGFDPSDVEKGRYADSLYVWDWAEHALKQTIPLGKDGAVPLETRFLHDPEADTGFVGAALASNILRFHKAPAGGNDWAAEVAIRQEWTPVDGWALPAMPPLISDIIISLDDRFLYFSNWLRGDICQYDITDPAAPKLVGQLFVGGR